MNDIDLTFWGLIAAFVATIGIVIFALLHHRKMGAATNNQVISDLAAHASELLAHARELARAPAVVVTDYRYIVQLGDTLSGIAAGHSVKTEDLAKWNAIADPNKIQAGQVLRLTPP